MSSHNFAFPLCDHVTTVQYTVYCTAPTSSINTSTVDLQNQLPNVKSSPFSRVASKNLISGGK